MQMIRLLAIIVLHFAVIPAIGFLDYDIIDAYFKEKHIKYASIIGCFTRKEQLNVSKRYRYKPTRIFNMSKINADRALHFLGHLGIILDGDSDDVRNFLLASGKLKYFDEKHHWLILTSREYFSNLFEDMEIYINADIKVVCPDENREISGNYSIYDVYNPSSIRGGDVKIQKVGFYNVKRGFIAPEKECKYFSRRNMTGVRLKNMVTLPVPFRGKLMDYLSSEEDKQINTFNRYAYNLMSHCQRYYNFSTDVKMTRTWGYKQKDGSFDGQVGALAAGQVDYGISPLLIFNGRDAVIKFGRQTWTLRSAFIFRNPKSASPIDGFVKPLSYSTWILTLASGLLLVVVLRLSCLYEERNVHQAGDVSWSYVAVCVVGALCQQGMSVSPRFSSGRIVTLFLFLFALLIYQFYSASLVSSLLMEPPTKIRSASDILHSNLKAGCEDLVRNRQYFSSTTDKASRMLYLEKLLGQNNNSNFVSVSRGLELVNEGQYAFYAEVDTAYPIIRNTFSDKAICELREVDLLHQQPLHVNYGKNSPYKEMFDTCLQRLAEMGIMARELKVWHQAKPECILSSKSGTFNIGLDEFYPALVLLGLGVLCSQIILIFEYYKCRLGGTKNRVIYPFIK